MESLAIRSMRTLYRRIPAREIINRRDIRWISTQNSNSETPSQPSETQQASTSENGTEPKQLNEIEQLTKQLEEKDEKIADLNDRTLRVLAEMENVRMIARRDVDNAKKYGIVPFAKALLSVADNIGLALKAVPKEIIEAEDADPQLKGLFVGVGATESELLKVFTQHGIDRFGAVGDKFDPNKYQAMFEVPSDSVEPGTVIDVTKLGYMIGDRVLRPAEAGVSKAP